MKTLGLESIEKTAAGERGGKMKRVWEISSQYFCPIVGHCLTYSAQLKIIKKCRLQCRRPDPFEAHELFVQQMQSETTLAGKVESLLNRKYRKEMSRWGETDMHAWPELVEKSLSHENFGALLWITAVCMELPPEVDFRVFGAFHMFDFELFFHQPSLHREINALQLRGREWEKKYSRLKTKNEELRNSNNESSKVIRELKQANRELLDKVKTGGEPEPAIEKTAALESELAELKLAYFQKLTEARKFEKELEEFHKKIREQQAEIGLLKREIQVFHEESCQNDSIHCRFNDKFLCARKILLVGGIGKLQGFYRRAVTEMGGEFEHHDGAYQGGIEKLSCQIARCDVVLCPVDVNSHSACSTVKKFSKKYNKPFYMLNNSGIGTLRRKLLEIAEQ